MKIFIVIIISFLLGFLFCIFYSNKYIHLSFMNGSNLTELNIQFKIDENPTKSIKLIKSPLASLYTVNQTSFGNHKIYIKCDQLKIEKTIEVFNFKNTYIDIEFQKEPLNVPEVLIRYSWFPLIYM